jgi:hypothetical protein
MCFSLDRAEAFTSKPARDDNAAQGGQPARELFAYTGADPRIASSPHFLPNPLLPSSDVELVEDQTMEHDLS